MGGGAKSVVNTIADAASPLTVGLLNSTKKELYDKPKQMQSEMERELREQEEAARRAEEDYKREQTEDKKRQRDAALQNLERTQARLRSLQPKQKGGYSGTILTSPLGISTAPETTGPKTLLGQ